MIGTGNLSMQKIILGLIDVYFELEENQVICFRSFL